MQLKSTLFTLLALLPAWLLTAQVEVRGTVLDSETALPIAAVVVTLDDGTTAVSDEKGYFAFFRVPEGAHDFTFQGKESYVEQTLSSTVKDQGGQVYNLGIVQMVPTQRDEGLTNKEDFIPTITLSDGDLEQETDNQNISGVLAASRDVFVSAAAFTFGPARFRIRGYDSENTAVYINGVPFNELENGRSFW
ncbi:MAG: TonB-dependent receptor plug domain-containing protein, partial [Phaeodactylibacter sp.]|nr:TonB-dependent receptor plug domain-containing protein [Phaeodactylibacter sp.]